MKVDLLLAHRAVALNLAGVLAMEEADHDNAITAFSQGLTALKSVLQDSTEWSPYLPEPESSLEGCFDFAKAVPPLSPTMHEKEGGFVFRSPISVTSTRFIGRYHFHAKFSFAALFNLALAHHLSALEKPSRKKLQKAQALYELAFSVHVNEGVDLTVLETMVIANNLGRVYALLEVKDKALQWCSHLVSLIVYASTLCDRDRPELIDKFVGNVMHLLLKNPGSNAPAA